MSLLKKLGRLAKTKMGQAAIGAFVPGGPAIVTAMNVAQSLKTPKMPTMNGGMPLGVPQSFLPTIMGGAVTPPFVSASTAAQVGMAGTGIITRTSTIVGSIIRSASGRIVGFFVGGRRISRKKAVMLAKKVGLDAAAMALGITAVELSQAILEESGAPRRGRGITATQLRNARRVNRRIISMTKDLQAIGSVTVKKGSKVCR